MCVRNRMKFVAYFRIAAVNKDTQEILEKGWTPVLSAMFISSLGGSILNQVITSYPNIALFQPVINGVAGNLGKSITHVTL